MSLVRHVGWNRAWFVVGRRYLSSNDDSKITDEEMKILEEQGDKAPRALWEKFIRIGFDGIVVFDFFLLQFVCFSFVNFLFSRNQKQTRWRNNVYVN
jgi:hypothetical protein